MKIRILAFFLFLFSFSGPVFSENPEERPDSPFLSDETKLSVEERLGKQLFEDETLSEPHGVSCASCHEPRKAFQSNNGSPIPALAKGSLEGSFGKRNVPTIAYSFLSPVFGFVKEEPEEGEAQEPADGEWKAVGGQFFDGRATDLLAQAEDPLLDPREMNNASRAAVVAKVKAAPYADSMREVYGADVFGDEDRAFAALSAALAAFQSTAAFAPFSSKFDRVLEGRAQFSALEAKGFELFKDKEKGNCIACHVGELDSADPRDWPFTDFTYDNLGIPRNGAIPENADGDYYDLGLCKRKDIDKYAPSAVDVASLCGAFKVPTLRNIALTAPYMHNGHFDNLRDVVRFYVLRDTDPGLWYPKNADGRVRKFDDLPQAYRGNVNVDEVPYDRKPGEAPRLDDAEVEALVAFLNTLTDE